MYPFLTDGDANLTEGSGYNIVLVKDGALFTPERGVLEGVTRSTVFDIAKKKGIEVNMQHVPVALAYEADEIFMCTTAGGIMPVTWLDGKQVKDGKIGPITSAIWDEYWKMHYDPAYSFEIKYDSSRDGRLLAKI
jgi:branched-subunit amino acid aminotransferase/4-amino-4-deoxychorismate lyase